MDTSWHQETGCSGNLSYESYYDLLQSAAYLYHITVNAALKCHRAYTLLTHEDNDFGMLSTDTELDHTEDNISTYQAYLTNLSSPSASHTFKVFSPSPFGMNLPTSSASSSLPTTRMLAAPAHILQIP